MPGERVVLGAVSFALCVDMLAYGAILPLLPAFGAEAALGQGAMGAVVATYALGLLASTPFLARAATDHPRGALVAGALTAAASSAAFALPPSLATLLAARALQGVAAGATWTAAFAVVARAFPAARRGAAMGLALAATAAGTALGPLGAAVLAERAGRRAAFFALAALAGASAALQALLVPRVPRASAPPPAASPLRSPEARAAAGIVFFAAIAITYLEPALPYRAGSSEEAGLALFAGAAANAVVTPAASAFTRGGNALRVSGAGAVVTALGALLAAGAASAPALIAACCVLGAGFGAAMAPALPALAEAVERAAERVEPRGEPPFGAAYAAFNAAYAAGMIVGPPLGAGLAERFGFTPAMLGLAGGAAVMAAGVRFARR